jgi:hypothetical protein
MRAIMMFGMTLLRDRLQDFELKDNTLSREVKNSDADRIQLEIGDSKRPTEALPQAKVMRWDNEVNLSVRRVMDMRGVTSRTEGEHVVFDSAKEEVHIYEKPDIAEDGGLEIEIHLKEKPDTNRFDFTIQTKGLNFYYQAPLTKEEIEQGVERPENVEGSYAVYHATKRDNRVGGKEYKAGKFCHIYRPHITDADGNETWGELELDEEAGVLTVVVPQGFLDKASYPVVVDPTFGYTTAGGSNDWYALYRTQFGSITRYITGGYYEATESGTVTKITARIAPWDTNDRVSGAIYKESDNSLVGEFDEITPPSSFNWNDLTADGEINITAQDYWLLLWGNREGSIDHNEGCALQYDSTGDGGTRTDSNYATWPDPITLTSQNRKYSIYATYTEASASKTNVKISGTFEPVTTNIKLSGTFVEKTMKVKVGGTFV